jgi:hypothetical protein
VRAGIEARPTRPPRLLRGLGAKLADIERQVLSLIISEQHSFPSHTRHFCPPGFAIDLTPRVSKNLSRYHVLPRNNLGHLFPHPIHQNEGYN